ncbi:hypothetical protein A2U01_0109304, partial [Trifolium medium]|nr:hypothetical protein [Trifolium medium]
MRVKAREEKARRAKRLSREGDSPPP